MWRRQRLLPILLLAFLALSACGGRDDGKETLDSGSESTGAEVVATPTIRPVQEADVSNPPLVALGEVLYQQQCAACHGQDLEGQPNWRRRNDDGTLPAPPHDITGHTWHHPDELLFEITKYGTTAVVGRGYKSNMIGFADKLDDTEIWAVLSYIKSRWPENIQAAQPK